MTKKIHLLLFLSSVLLWGCAAPPVNELRRAQSAVAIAYAEGAPRMAPTEYQSAAAALRDGERLVCRRKYEPARETLFLAELHALRAIHLTHEERALLEAQKAREQEISTSPKPALQKPAKKPPSSSPEQDSPPLPPTPPPPLVHYTVGEGENLWVISARGDIYADALLWPILYRANRDQIRDPRQIHPGQVLDVPRDVPEADRQEAVTKARESEIFPIELLLKNRHPKQP